MDKMCINLGRNPHGPIETKNIHHRLSYTVKIINI